MFSKIFGMQVPVLLKTYLKYVFPVVSKIFTKTCFLKPKFSSVAMIFTSREKPKESITTAFEISKILSTSNCLYVFVGHLRLCVNRFCEFSSLPIIDLVLNTLTVPWNYAYFFCFSDLTQAQLQNMKIKSTK